jgi:hypothetical protein
VGLFTTSFVACGGFEGGDNAHTTIEVGGCWLVVLVAFKNALGGREHVLDSCMHGILVIEAGQVKAHFTNAHNVGFVLLNSFESVLDFFMFANAGNPLDWIPIALM